jgi:transcriptional regulator with XRE-family HTH domain
MANAESSVESRALVLLAQGIDQVQVAKACGVSESAISQLISRDDFATQLSEARYIALARHSATDNTYDTLEEELQAKLRALLPMMFKPDQVLRALQVVNQAKRRGSSTPEAILEKREVIHLSMPTQIINRFAVNTMNQVVHAGQQQLVTIQSGNMDSLATKIAPTKVIEALEASIPKQADINNVRYATTIKDGHDDSLELIDLPKEVRSQFGL